MLSKNLTLRPPLPSAACLSIGRLVFLKGAQFHSYRSICFLLLSPISLLASSANSCLTCQINLIILFACAASLQATCLSHVFLFSVISLYPQLCQRCCVPLIDTMHLIRRYTLIFKQLKNCNKDKICEKFAL